MTGNFPISIVDCRSAAFLDWCEGRSLEALAQIQPIDVADYIEELQGKIAATTVKQHLAYAQLKRALSRTKAGHYRQGFLGGDSSILTR